MRSSRAPLLLAVLAAWLGAQRVFADELPAARTPSVRGALVVALGDEQKGAAKVLARDVYRDEVLRPAVDDETARILVGDKPKEDASPKLLELAEVRASISVSPEDESARRLLASFGAERHAEIVVVVSMVSGRTIARVLRVEGARYEPLELLPTVESVPGSEARFSWPDATATLRRFVRPIVTSNAPLLPLRVAPVSTPKPVPKDAGSSWYKSPWLWGPIGAVVVVGAAILVASRVTADDHSTARLTGTVSP